MKNTLANLMVGLCVALFGACALGDAPGDNNTPTPYRVACVGDSITQGTGAPFGQSYPDQMQAILGADYQVKNFGVSGRTLLKKGDFPYWNEKAFQAAQDFQPNAVIIMLGTNDTKPQNWAHHDDFYADYKELVETFKNLASKPHVFICRPCPVPEPGNYGINETNIQIEIPVIDQVAADEKVEVIDIHAALADKPELFPDRVHPNAKGAEIIAITAALPVKARKKLDEIGLSSN